MELLNKFKITILVYISLVLKISYSQCVIPDTIKPTVKVKSSIVKYINSVGSSILSINDIDDGSSDNCTSVTKLKRRISFGSQSNQSTISFNCNDLGSKNITFIVEDSSGNISSKQTTIIVLDTIPPIINTNLSFIRKLGNSGTATLSVSELNNNSTDNCTSQSSLIALLSYGSQVDVSTVNFSCSDIGIRNVVFSVKDSKNNMSTIKVTVNVVDSIKPTINIKSNIKKYLNSSGLAVLNIGEVDNGSIDNCTATASLIKNFTVGTLTKQSSINLSCVDIGNKVITYSVVDAQGNEANVNLQITILDTIKPVINLRTNIIKYLSSNGLTSVSVHELENGSTDNCTSTNQLSKYISYGNSFNQNIIYFNCGNRGSLSLNYSVIDVSGNIAKREVTINIKDSTKPVIKLKSPVIYYPNNGGTLNLTSELIDSTSFDNCNLDFQFYPKYLTGNNLGSNLVFVKISDSSGNTNSNYTFCELKDSTPPQLEVAPKVTLFLGNSGTALLSSDFSNSIGQDINFLIKVKDNCDKRPDITLSKTIFSNSDLNNSPQFVKVQASDKSGNSSIKYLKVEVKDTIKPKIHLKRNIFFTLNTHGLLNLSPSDIDSGSYDNSNYLKVELGRKKFTCKDVGKNLLVVKVSDASSNSVIDTVSIFINHNNLFGTIYSKLNIERAILCKDFKTARIGVETIGGTPPFKFDWLLNSSKLKTTFQGSIDSLGAGYYSVIISDTNGCVKKDSIVVMAPPNYLPKINKSRDTTICKGQNLGLLVSGGNSYEWTRNEYLKSTNLPYNLVSPLVSTVFQVKVTDFNGCSNIDSIKVNVRPLPTVNVLTSQKEICEGYQTFLTAGGAQTYKWYPEKAVDNNAIASVKTSVYKSSWIRVKGIDQYGCENFDSIFITVNPLPVIQISKPDSICLGSTKQIIASGGVDYKWNGLNINNPNIPNPVVNPISSSKYIVEVKSSQGCLNLDSTIIFVKSNPLPSIISGDLFVCQNTNWQKYIVPEDSRVQRIWSVENGIKNFSDNKSISINWKSGSGGKVLVKETFKNAPFCSTVQTVDVKFLKTSALPKTDIIIKGNNTQSNILISKSQNHPEMIWGYESKVDFNEIETCKNSNWCKFPFIDTLNYRYWVKIGDSLNCLQKSYLNSPSYLSSDNIDLNRISVFPNPTNGQINIVTPNKLENVSIYNSIGLQVFYSIESNIDLSFLPPGSYFAEITQSNGFKAVNKFILIK